MNDKLAAIVKSIAEIENLVKYTTEISTSSAKGDGFMGIIKFLTITGQSNNDETKTVNCIVKCASNNETLRNSANVGELYQNEIFAYENIVPTYRNFEIEKGLKPFIFAPKFYGSVSEAKSEALILENLTESQYKLYANNCSMDDQHLKLVLTTYGRYHALSFALRDQQEAKFNDLTKNMYLTTKLIIQKLRKTIIGLGERGIATLDPKSESQAVTKYRSFLENLEAFGEELNVSPNYDHCVILHGDCWTNNMMFKYDHDGTNNLSKPTSVRFFDYQLLRLDCPVLDVVYFFYACCSLELMESIDYYLEIYYSSLSEHLNKLGSNVDKLYPHSVFKEQFQKYAKTCLILVPIIFQIAATEKNNSIDLDEVVTSDSEFGEAFNYEPPNMEFFNMRMRSLILHLDKNDIL